MHRKRTELQKDPTSTLCPPLLAEDVILELENQSISNDGTFYVGFQDRSQSQVGGSMSQMNSLEFIHPLKLT